EDHGVTRRLVEAGKVLGIPIMDHVVVAEQGYYSFQAAGDLARLP
ncbi:MAG: JAB domain-containing protein, partial [Myxococcota bacterium]|nr:JAB domain-containing protein [Myxococcota bacterium]